MVLSLANAFITVSAEVLAPPIIHNLTILPENPNDNNNLRCVWNIKEYNNEEFSVKVNWYVNGVLTNYSSDVIDASLTKQKEVWLCYIVATDSSGMSSDASAGVEITENAPVITGKIVGEVEKPKLPMFLQGLLDIFSKIFGW